VVIPNSRSQRLKAPRGSYEAQRWLATEEADELEVKAQENAYSDEFLLYRYAALAFEHAIVIAKMTRCEKTYTAEQFVWDQTRLFEYVKRLENYPNLKDLLSKWPKNPGIKFCWFAGQNALDVAVKFVRMISTGVITARNEIACHGVTSYDSLRVSPEPDPAFEEWRDRTIRELLAREIPKPDVWPSTADINCEYESLLHKLYDEYNQAIERESQISKAKLENMNTREKQEGTLEPKPPEFLQNLLWILRYGRKYWKPLVIAGFILLVILVAGLFKEEIRTRIAPIKDGQPEISGNSSKETKERLSKIEEMVVPPTLSFLKERLSIVKTDTGYTAILVFEPSKNRPPLGPTSFVAKVVNNSNAKIIGFDEIGSDHYRTLSRKISDNHKEAQFTYDPGHFEFPKVSLITSEKCKVQISSSHITEPFLIDIE
jgi:hypothetical protein